MSKNPTNQQLLKLIEERIGKNKTNLFLQAITLGGVEELIEASRLIHEKIQIVEKFKALHSAFAAFTFAMERAKKPNP